MIGKWETLFAPSYASIMCQLGLVLEMSYHSILQSLPYSMKRQMNILRTFEIVLPRQQLWTAAQMLWVPESTTTICQGQHREQLNGEIISLMTCVAPKDVKNVIIITMTVSTMPTIHDHGWLAWLIQSLLILLHEVLHAAIPYKGRWQEVECTGRQGDQRGQRWKDLDARHSR